MSAVDCFVILVSLQLFVSYHFALWVANEPTIIETQAPEELLQQLHLIVSQFKKLGAFPQLFATTLQRAGK